MFHNGVWKKWLLPVLWDQAVTESLSVPGSEVSCDSASCTGGQCETGCTTGSVILHSDTDIRRGPRSPVSGWFPDHKLTFLLRIYIWLNVLKSVLVCLVHCATAAYIILNVFLRTEVCLFCLPIGFFLESQLPWHIGDMESAQMGSNCFLN